MPSRRATDLAATTTDASTRPAMVAGSADEPAEQELGLPGLVDLALGYQRAQVLLTANELDLFRLLADGSRTAPEVAAVLGAEPRGVEALLEACVGLGLLRHDAQGYENSRTARLFLLPGREASFSPVLRFWHRVGYGLWGRLAAALRDGPSTAANDNGWDDVFERIRHDEEYLRLFCDGLAGLAYWPARKLAGLVDLSDRRHLLDLGGGAGAFAAAFASRYPHLRVTVFDLGPVSALAAERLRNVDAGGRLQTVAGDFFREPLPRDCDVVLLSHVLHDWGAEECVHLLRKAHEALPDGGEVIVHDFMPAERSASPEASLFALTLVLDTARGRVYTLAEIQRWLAEVGFRRLRHEAVAGGTSVVTGFKGR